MRAGSLREFITFIELHKTQTPSGAFKEEWVEVYKCRAFLKKSSPVYDKDGVNAHELYQGTNRYMVVRNNKKINEKQRLVWKGDVYEILLIQPQYDDNTLLIQVRRHNE